MPSSIEEVQCPLDSLQHRGFSIAASAAQHNPKLGILGRDETGESHEHVDHVVVFAERALATLHCDPVTGGQQVKRLLCCQVEAKTVHHNLTLYDCRHQCLDVA